MFMSGWVIELHIVFEHLWVANMPAFFVWVKLQNRYDVL